MRHSPHWLVTLPHFGRDGGSPNSEIGCCVCVSNILISSTSRTQRWIFCHVGWVVHLQSKGIWSIRTFIRSSPVTTSAEFFFLWTFWRESAKISERGEEQFCEKGENILFPIIFLCVSDAKFNVDYDSAIKHYLILFFG